MFYTTFSGNIYSGSGFKLKFQQEIVVARIRTHNVFFIILGLTGGKVRIISIGTTRMWFISDRLLSSLCYKLQLSVNDQGNYVLCHPITGIFTTVTVVNTELLREVQSRLSQTYPANKFFIWLRILWKKTPDNSGAFTKILLKSIGDCYRPRHRWMKFTNIK